MLYLQRVMRLVSWMACWRRCSLALLSGEREDHGKQVLTHKQNSKSSGNLFKSVMSHLIYRCMFPFTHICGMRTILKHVTCEANLFSLFISVYMFLSTYNSRFVCVPSVHRLWVVVIFCPWLHGGKDNSTNGWHNRRRERVPRVGVGSGILKRVTTGEGVVVELENIRGI